MKLDLVKDIIESNRRQAEPFIASYGLDWKSITLFTVEHGLADRHTIYQPEFAGCISILAHPLYQRIMSLKNLALHDVGCGLGLNARYLQFDGCSDVSASDIDSMRMEQSHLLFDDHVNSRIQFAVADVRDLTSTYGLHSFAAIYSGFVLHQLTTLNDAQQALRECARATLPSGLFLGMTRGTCKEGSSYELVHIEKNKTRLLLSPGTLDDLLRKTGYSDIQISTTLLDPDLHEIVIYYTAQVK